MLRFSCAALVFIAAASLAGCATATDSCDPRTSRELLEEAGCIFSGRTEEFIAEQKRELQRLKSDRRLTEIETREIEMEAERLAKDTHAFSRELEQQQKQLGELRAKLEDRKKLTDRLQARKIVLINEIDALNSELQTESQATVRAEARVVQLKTDIAMRRAVVEAMAIEVLKE